MKYTSPIDPHVHLRGLEYKEPYAKWAFEDADECGFDALIEQPNPQPWLTSKESLDARYSSIGREINPRVGHHIHIGLTNDLVQVKRALELVHEGFASADKTFYTHSTGNMGVLDPDYQLEIWRLKGGMGYTGISIGHFEDEALFEIIFDWRFPITHSWRQNSDAEYIQVERQLRNASDCCFQGVFYIAHVTHPAIVDLVRSRSWKFKVVVEATWHHLFLNHNDYGLHGNRIKMNPPLRPQKVQEKLLDYLLRGYINVIGSDHAPHPLVRKDSEQPPSGIPALPFWPRGVQLLRKLKMEEHLISEVTRTNANELFSLGLPDRQVEVEYNLSLWDKYGYNPFSRLN